MAEEKKTSDVPERATQAATRPTAVPLNEFILIPEHYCHRDLEELKNRDLLKPLMDSIIVEGLQTAVEFYRGPDGKPIITKGHRRISAMRQLAAENTPGFTDTMVVESVEVLNASQQDLLCRSVSDNANRKDYTLGNRIRAAKTMHDGGVEANSIIRYVPSLPMIHRDAAWSLNGDRAKSRVSAGPVSSNPLGFWPLAKNETASKIRGRGSMLDKHLLEMMANEVLTSGVPNPVVLVLTGKSMHARRIAEDIEARVVPATILLPVADDGGSLVLVAAADAASLLREHAGNGGSYVAEMLDRPTDVDFRLVSVMPEILGLASYFNGVEIARGATHYDQIDRCGVFELAKDPAVSLINVKSPDGDRVPVCGQTGQAALTAAFLVDMVTNRRLDIPFRGEVRRHNLTDDLLADILNLFRDLPRAIAEAIMSLRKMKGHKDRLLTRVLWGRPELRELAKKVHSELTGE